MESRTKNAEKNIISASVYQLLNIVFKFFLRTVFIYTLGKEYLGINGVFTNVLSILSLSELGLASAIIYDMYRPIAQNDTNKINSLLAFYRRVYAYIGIFIFIIGGALTPFLDVIVTDVPDIAHIELIYIMYVFNVASTYFFAHYTSLLNAYQNNHIVTNNSMKFSVLKTLVEACLLWVMHSYIVYLTIEIGISIIQNIVICFKARRMFPFIKVRAERLPLEESREIFKNAFSNFSVKISGAVIGGTDNILISMLVSTVLVGVYSNYAMIIQIIQSTTVMFMNAILSGVGNVCAQGSVEEKAQLFKKINFFFVSVYACICVVFISVIDPFIMLWIGESYILPLEVELVIILNCLMVGMKQVSEIFVSADGLFQRLKIVPLIAAGLNLIISLFLGSKIGMVGILLGTTISQALTNTWYYPYIVHKHTIKDSFGKYAIGYVKNTILIMTIALFSRGIVNIIGRYTKDLYTVVLGIASSVFLLTVVWCCLYHTNEEFKYFISLVKSRVIEIKIRKRN